MKNKITKNIFGQFHTTISARSYENSRIQKTIRDDPRQRMINSKRNGVPTSSTDKRFGHMPTISHMQFTLENVPTVISFYRRYLPRDKHATLRCEMSFIIQSNKNFTGVFKYSFSAPRLRFLFFGSVIASSPHERPAESSLAFRTNNLTDILGGSTVLPAYETTCSIACRSTDFSPTCYSTCPTVLAPALRRRGTPPSSFCDIIFSIMAHYAAIHTNKPP